MKLNGVLLDMFGRSRLAHYQSVQQHLSGIEQRLTDITQIKPSISLHLEKALLEEFHYASINVYQAKDETINTFNIYLIGTGILAAGMTAILTVIVPEHGSVVTALEGLSIILLIVMGVISYGFLNRFIQLAKERYKNEITIDKIKEIYRNRLEAEMNTKEKIFYKKQDRMFEGVSALMLVTVISLGNLEIGGATFILFFFIVFYYNLWQYSVLLAVIIALIISLVVAFLTSTGNYFLYYRRKINKIVSEFQKDEF